MAIMSYVPAMIVDPDSPIVPLIRTMFGLILIALIVYAIAMIPFSDRTFRGQGVQPHKLEKIVVSRARAWVAKNVHSRTGGFA